MYEMKKEILTIVVYYCMNFKCSFTTMPTGLPGMDSRLIISNEMSVVNTC